jgi:hypothetical protein
MLRSLALGILTSAAFACGGEARGSSASPPVDLTLAESLSRVRDDSINRSRPGYIVDSILPPSEDLRRFRASLPGDSARTLVGGAPSRDKLVRRFLQAVAENDSTALRAMVVGAREFADLYYPESPQSRAPYRQPISFAWRMIQDPSAAGFSKLLRRLGGERLAYLGHRCDPAVHEEGRTRRYAGCLVRVVLPAGDTATKRYFGSIVERDGQFKFLSYTNDF